MVCGREPNTPPQVLKNLAEAGRGEVQEWVAQNRTTPPEVPKNLAEVGSEEVQKWVAANLNTPGRF